MCRRGWRRSRARADTSALGTSRGGACRSASSLGALSKQLGSQDAALDEGTLDGHPVLKSIAGDGAPSECSRRLVAQPEIAPKDARD
jgi:hypothetical protein